MARKRGSDLHDADYAGPAARAWTVTDPDLGRPPSSAVGIWLIEATSAHLVWNYRLVSIAHLREHRDLPQPVLTREGATHELVIVSLDPDHDNTVDPTDLTTMKILTPVDVAQQLVLPDDNAAFTLGTLAVQLCVEGRLVPDSDFRTTWQRWLLHQERALANRPGPGGN